MAFSNAVDTTTEDFLVPRLVDNVLRSNTFTKDILRGGRDGRNKFKSGTMLFPIKYQTGTAGQAFSGFDQLPTSASTTRVNMTYIPKFYAVNVALPLTDLMANDTENQVLNLADIEMASRGQDMADAVGTIFYGDGTGAGGKEFNGLANIVDDGSVSSTIGGLSRTTYTVLNSVVTASGGTVSLSKLSTLYMAITDDSIMPTDIYSTPTIYSLYESLLTPMQRLDTGTVITDAGLSATSGFTKLGYKGMPFKVDRKCTSGVLFMLNLDFVRFYALPANTMGYTPAKYQNAEIVGNDYSKAPGLGFSWSGWIKATNAAAYNGFVVLGGQLMTDDPLRSGKLTGITSV